MIHKKQQFDYRALYKMLKKYFEFTFKIPHYKKDFTSQQKSSITRKYLKIIPYLTSNWEPNTEEITYLKYPKGSRLPGVDGVRTNYGIFYKWPQAKLAKSKIEKNKWLVVVNPKIKKGAVLEQKRRDIFIPFPNRVRRNIESIKKFVEYITEKYRPQSVMWGYNGKRERTRYLPELFDLYFSDTHTNASYDYENDEYEYEDTGLDYVSLTKDEILSSEIYKSLSDSEKIDLWRRRSFRKKLEKNEPYYNGVFLIYYLN